VAGQGPDRGRGVVHLPQRTQSDLLAESVTGLSFAYFDATNTPVPSPPTGPYSLDGQGLAAVPSFANTNGARRRAAHRHRRDDP